jgi:hypothetical protein
MDSHVNLFSVFYIYAEKRFSNIYIYIYIISVIGSSLQNGDSFSSVNHVKRFLTFGLFGYTRSEL